MICCGKSPPENNLSPVKRKGELSMYKKFILKRSLCALLSVIIIAACLPLSVFAADPSEPQFSSDAANTLMKNTKPTGFDNTTNPYGYAVGRPFAMVEKNELLYFETYGTSATGERQCVKRPAGFTADGRADRISSRFDRICFLFHAYR